MWTAGQVLKPARGSYSHGLQGNGPARRMGRAGAGSVAVAGGSLSRVARFAGAAGSRMRVIRASEGEEESSSLPTDSISQSTGKDSWVTGGFAGGEKGLKQFVSLTQQEKEAAAAPSKVEDDDTSTPAPEPLGKGKDKIYIGKAKYVKGAKGRFIQDDDRLYPDKEDVLGVKGATGGFAGGEVGLKTFVATGDIPIKNEGDRFAQKQPTSPLILAFGLGGAATLGAILFDPESFVAEVKDVKGLLAQGDLAAVGAKVGAAGGGVAGDAGDVASAAAGALSGGDFLAVKLLAVAALGGVGVYGASQIAQATKSLAAKAKDGVVGVVFGLVVFKAAITILNN